MLSLYQANIQHDNALVTKELAGGHTRGGFKLGRVTVKYLGTLEIAMWC